jgi:hypothetical protein
MINMYIGLHVKYRLLLPDCKMKMIFLDRFSKNPQTSEFIKIRPVEAELFHEDRGTYGRTDMTKPTVAFSNFANAPKKNSQLLNKFFYVIYPNRTKNVANRA